MGFSRLGDIRLRLHRRHHPVSQLGHGLDVPRLTGRVAENPAQFLDGRVEPVLEIDERLRGPEPLPQLVSRHQFPGALQQNLKHLEGLVPQLQP